MLVVGRELDQEIIIDGRIVVKVVEIRRDYVRLGIEADESIPVHRAEVQRRIDSENAKAAGRVK